LATVTDGEIIAELKTIQQKTIDLVPFTLVFISHLSSASDVKKVFFISLSFIHHKNKNNN